MSAISDNLSHVHALIGQAASSSGARQEVRLLCVTKTKPEEMVEEAYRCGERLFGESYAVEASEKIEHLREKGYKDIVWHFIGPIQKNKTRLIAEHFDVVESVDRPIIAERLSDQRPAGMKPLEVMIEVNISGEEQKSGCAPEDVASLAACIASRQNLVLTGLMGVAKDTADRAEIDASFKKLASMFEAMKKDHPSLKVLSMGMTHDMDIAIADGSTEVRIGTAIFGAREYAHQRLDDSKKVAFIGGGNMASCIFASVKKSVSPRNITVSGPHLEKLQHFKDDGASVTTDNAAAARQCGIIFLGVKPQVLTGVLEDLSSSGVDFKDKLVISMAAGFCLSSLKRLTGSDRLVRIMPNTPAMIGQGVTALCCGSGATEEDVKLVKGLLDGMGEVIEGDEKQLDVVGAVAGCGPAFVYRFMEALVAESVRNGMDPKAARAMVEQLVAGSAAMVSRNQDRTLAQLREAVTSKGGTTYAGLCKMTEGHFEEMMR
ncbi:MAG: pyrroline-5-carboxylate reductase, partial [Succinivibrio sp.]